MLSSQLHTLHTTLAPDPGPWTLGPAQNKSILILQVKYINPAGFRFKIAKFGGLPVILPVILEVEQAKQA